MASTLSGSCKPQSKTRAGATYGRVPPRVIVCSPSFPISQCLQDAVAAEEDAPPDIDHVHAPKRTHSSMADDHSAPLSQPPMDVDFPFPLLPPGTFSHPIPQPHRAVYRYNTHSERNKARKRAKCTKKREDEFLRNAHDPRPEVVQQHVASSSDIPIPIDLDSQPANSSGYDALSKDPGVRKSLQLKELVEEGYDAREWDGRESFILVDADTQKVIGVGVGMPKGAGFQQTCKNATDFMQEVARGEVFKKTELEHKRGDPRRSWSPAAIQPTQHGSRRRAAFKLYAPDLYDYCHHHTIPLREHMPHLRASWDLSIFSAAAFNLGPNVVTYFHRDCMSLAFGWCAIHALGQYDHKKGGHLVLKEAKLVIEFPPGALILLPSATIMHGNTGIQVGETRLSFTQCSSGAMFRYVDNGFRTVEQLKNANKAAYETMLNAKAVRWRYGLGLWSTVEDILKRAGLREEGEVLA